MALERFLDALSKVAYETQKSAVDFLLGISVDSDHSRIFRDADAEKNDLILKPEIIALVDYTRDRLRDRERERAGR